MKNPKFLLPLAMMLMLLIAVPLSGIAKPKVHLPFAPKGKYGMLPTKKARMVSKNSWRFNQWGR